MKPITALRFVRDLTNISGRHTESRGVKDQKKEEIGTGNVY